MGQVYVNIMGGFYIPRGWSQKRGGLERRGPGEAWWVFYPADDRTNDKQSTWNRTRRLFYFPLVISLKEEDSAFRACLRRKLRTQLFCEPSELVEPEITSRRPIRV